MKRGHGVLRSSQFPAHHVIAHPEVMQPVADDDGSKIAVGDGGSHGRGRNGIRLVNCNSVGLKVGAHGNGIWSNNHRVVTISNKLKIISATHITLNAIPRGLVKLKVNLRVICPGVGDDNGM